MTNNDNPLPITTARADEYAPQRVEVQTTSYATILQDTDNGEAWIAAGKPWVVER